MATDKDSIGGFVHECFYGCNSAEHASHLSAVLTKNSLSDEKVAAYLKWYCTKYARGVDSSGRNLLHLAASKGRLKLLKFLLAHREININGKDRESLYTALHRSAFYGQIHCAVRLIEAGANIQQNDGEDLTPLDHIMKDRPSILSYNNNHLCEVYVWGTNTNYNLGIGHHHSRSNIEPLDMFRKENISIKQVLMSKFHSLFIGSNGKVWACGLGSGGRLGLGNENTTLVPKILKIGSSSECCKAASVGIDHSILLMENGTVWSFGLNNYYQLGHSPPPDKILSPKILKSLKGLNIIGISASKFHSVFWTKNQVFTCGLNGGQLGHSATIENKIDTPKLVTSLKLNSTTIKHISSSDGATVIVTDRDDIFLFREYVCKKITTKFNRVDAKKICVLGGRLDHKVLTSYLEESGGDDLKILIVTKKDTIYLWQETWQQMTQCLLSIRRDVVITDIVLNKAVVIITTKDGEAFEGEIKSKKRKITLEDEKSPTLKSKGNKFLAKEDCDYIKIKKIPHIHRAVNAASDLKGRNFAVVQVHPKSGLLNIPLVESTEMKENMKMFLDSTNEFDSLHDVVFEVDNITFPAHRYIVSHSCKVLEEIINKAEFTDGVCFVRIENVQAQIFKRILTYLYTGECDLLKTGHCPIIFNSIDSYQPKIMEEFKELKEGEEYIIDDSNISAFEHYKRQRSNKKKKDLKIKSDGNNPLKALKDAAKIFELTSLLKILESLHYDNGYICTIKGNNVKCSPPKFNRKNFQNLWDINLKAEDEIIIEAHKCILTARSEYFNCMINQGWLEASLKTPLKLPIPSTVLEILISYFYTDEAPEIIDTYDIDLASHILVIADQFFCTRLKEIAEVSLANIINLKNAAEMLQLAVTYNANQLKQTSMEFICLNLSALLESRSLEILDDGLLTELKDFYRSWLPCLSNRTIAPDSNAPSDDLVEKVFNSEPVSLDKVEEEPLIIIKPSSKTPKKKFNKERKNNDSERKRNTSVGSTTSDEEIMNSFNKEIENDSWIMVTSHGSKHHVKAQTKIKETQIVNSVKQSPDNTNIKTPFIPIPKSNPIDVARVSAREQKNSCSESDTENCFLSTSSDKEFPALSASAPERTITIISPKSPSAPNKKFVKLSQKQRKKLAKQSISEDEETIAKPPETLKSVWSVPKYEFNTMAEIMKEEIKASHLGTSWPGPSSASLTAIMAAERRQRDLLMKMKSKSLEHAQMEDKAIDDLNILYDISNVTDERITVRRAESIIFSPPVWVSGHR